MTDRLSMHFEAMPVTDRLSHNCEDKYYLVKEPFCSSEGFSNVEIRREGFQKETFPDGCMVFHIGAWSSRWFSRCVHGLPDGCMVFQMDTWSLRNAVFHLELHCSTQADISHSIRLRSHPHDKQRLLAFSLPGSSPFTSVTDRVTTNCPNPSCRNAMWSNARSLLYFDQIRRLRSELMPFVLASSMAGSSSPSSSCRRDGCRWFCSGRPTLMSCADTDSAFWLAAIQSVVSKWILKP